MGIIKGLTDTFQYLIANITGPQLGIFLFGCAAIWFVGRPESWRRWGYICGMFAQVFWFTFAIKNRYWGILAVSFVYASMWAQGVWFHWLKPDALRKSYFRRLKALALERKMSEKDLLIEVLQEYFERHPAGAS